MPKKKNLNESREIVFTALEDLKSWLRNLLRDKKEELDVKNTPIARLINLMIESCSTIINPIYLRPK